MEGLTPGRIVHYQDGRPSNSKPLAAIVTKILVAPDGAVDLAVFVPGNGSQEGCTKHVTNVLHARWPEMGRWNWIPKA